MEAKDPPTHCMEPILLEATTPMGQLYLIEICILLFYVSGRSQQDTGRRK